MSVLVVFDGGDDIISGGEECVTLNLQLPELLGKCRRRMLPMAGKAGRFPSCTNDMKIGGQIHPRPATRRIGSAEPLAGTNRTKQSNSSITAAPRPQSQWVTPKEEGFPADRFREVPLRTR